ncbi:AI-2E family transporter [Prochlorococcus sp. MIT 1300]|uniref:AI-2E family transporter n=1 Tax=Prochlorococcus sp. MIT 1300 TaxID=3096218 RepID=UPI002A7575BE|nr:AI-2E family transporter [Prochlorococcus sp. MIT 1300]
MNARTLLIATTLVVITLLTWQLRWVLLIIFGAIVLAVALDVPIKKLNNLFHWPRAISLLIVLLFITLGGSIVFILLVPELLAQVNAFSDLFPTLLSKLSSIVSDNPRLVILKDSAPQLFEWQGIQPVGFKILGFAGGAANSLLQFFLISLLAILLALDPNSHRKILIAATPRPARIEMIELLNSCRENLGGWLAGMTISACSIFFLTWAALALLNMPLALLCALVCGLLTFIPTIGPTTATLLPLGIALLISPSLMLKVLITRLILQNLEAFIITPILLRRTVSLLPTVALTAQLSLGVLLGLPGVILALPLTVVLQVIFQRVLVKQITDRWN